MILYLENDSLRVAVHPNEGGRVASIRSRTSGTEFLLQSPDAGPAFQQGMEARFEDGYCAGIEECLPSVGSCGPETSGGPVPDHGDFWQLPWLVEHDPSPSTISMHATGFSRPLHFRKQLRLHESGLSIDYVVTNVGVEAVSFLYACHPLLAVEEGDAVVLAPEMSALRLHSSRNQRLGRYKDEVAWPHGPRGDLSRVPAPGAGTADMLYTSRLTQGCCGLYRASTREGIGLHFDTARLPYLGIWLCYGGWPDTDDAPKQYAVALEPTTAAHGTLMQSQQAGEAVHLGVGQTAAWQIRFEISGPFADLDGFQAAIKER